MEAFLLDDKTLVARAVRVEETDEVTERSAVRFEGTVQKVNDDDTFVVNGMGFIKTVTQIPLNITPSCLYNITHIGEWEGTDARQKFSTRNHVDRGGKAVR